MQPRAIPGTSLAVSPLCLGTMTFGTPVGEGEAIRLTHWGLDHGVNFIDTANIYEGYTRFPGSAGGVAEQLLGQALAGRRPQAVVATKVGLPIGPGAEDRGLRRPHIQRECERSLARLRTDWIDIYYMHRPDPDTPLEESIAAFAHLIQAGKIRHWGISGFSATQTRQVLATCGQHGWPPPAVHQPAYSLLRRDLEADLLPLCRQEGIGVVPYQVLQGGLLTGKYQDPSVPPAGSRGQEKPEWIPLLQDPAVHAQLSALTAQARAQGLSLFEYALQTVIRTPGITSLILGVKSTGQLEEAIRALRAC